MTGAFVAATFITKSGSSYWSSYTMMAGIGLLANFGPNSQDYSYCPYGPRFPLDAIRMASSTSRFAAAIAYDGIEDDNEPLGSGRLLRCLVVEKNSCVKFSRLLTTAKIF